MSRRWFPSWNEDPHTVPVPMQDELARKALRDLETPEPVVAHEPMQVQRKEDSNYLVDEGIAGDQRIDNMVWSVSVAPPVYVFCGSKPCGARHLEPLKDYSSTAHFVCPKCKVLNVKKPLRSLTDPDPEEINVGQWGQLPKRRKRGESMK